MSSYDVILSPQDVAELLKMHLKTIYKLARKKQLPGVKIGGSWRFKRSDILELLRTPSQEEKDE